MYEMYVLGTNLRTGIGILSCFSIVPTIVPTGVSCFPLTQARLAQSVEHQTFNLRVAGSSPSSGDENFEKSVCKKMTAK